LTAEPVVTTTTIAPADMANAFIVMGTDGLWEKLTNEEVVGLVGRFLDRKTEKPGWFGKSDALNVVEPAQIEGSKTQNGGSKRTRKWAWQDGNAATHLIRNALGGGNEDEVSP
jgi:pyruvate dehydrogenase phosphatase